MSAMENSDQLWEAPPAPEVDGVPMADWWRRFAALIVDIAVMWIPLAFLTRDMDRIPGFVVGVAIGVTYFSLLNGGRRGQTLGKMVWQVTGPRRRHRRPARDPQGRRAVPRSDAPLSDSVPRHAPLDRPTASAALWDRRRQTVHDKLAGSVVVSAR